MKAILKKVKESENNYFVWIDEASLTDEMSWEEEDPIGTILYDETRGWIYTSWGKYFTDIKFGEQTYKTPEEATNAVMEEYEKRITENKTGENK